MRKKDHIGVCHVCGRVGPLTFEHIPPHAAGNNHTVQIYSGSYSGQDVIQRSLAGQTNMEDLKYQQSQRGFGFYSLCADCNNYFGHNYVEEFNHFYGSVGHALLTSHVNVDDSVFEAKVANIMLLSFFKQVISNFCSTTSPTSMRDCRDFLLHRENTDFPDSYRLQMFVIPDLRVQKTVTGWAQPVFDDGIHYRVAGICIPPFGFLLWNGERVDTEIRFGDITNLSKIRWGKDPITHFTIPIVHGDKAGSPFWWPIIVNSKTTSR